jgi:hypothetical protein
LAAKGCERAPLGLILSHTGEGAGQIGIAQRHRKIHTRLQENDEMQVTSAAMPPQFRRAAFASAIAALLAVPLAAQSGGEVVKKPKLAVEESRHETGEIARDQVVEHTFKLRNSGDAPLLFLKIIQPPNLEIVNRPTELAPGAAGELKVRVPLLHDKAVALLKQIELQTNDPENPSFMLELRIRSTEYVVAKPGYARWISVQFEKPGTISQNLTARDGTDFEVQRTTAPPAGVTSAFSVAKQEPGKAREWKLDLTLAEDAPIGPILGTMLVYVNHPKQSIVPIPLSGFMRPMIAVTPPAVNIGTVKLVKKETQTISVKSFTTQAVLITKIEHDMSGIPAATFELLPDRREYMVRLEFDPATAPKGAFQGTLKVFTDNAKTPVVLVPVSGTIE